MRIALLAVLTLLSCSSEKEGKQAPAGNAPGAAPEATADLGNVPKGVKGSLELTGPFPGTYTWKPDLAMSCGCSVNEKKGVADFTMSDASGKTFISATYKDGSIAVRTASGPGGLVADMAGTGGTMTCAGGEWMNNAMHLALDADMKGPKGETGHVKASLDLGCQ